MTPIVSMLLLFTLSPAVLGSSEPQREGILFSRADENTDGHLTETELRHVFLGFDTNDDGTITKDEFVADWTTIYSLGSSKEAETLFARADSNLDGVVTDADLPAIFAYFDMNGDGLVDLNEFLTQWGDLRLDAPDTVTIRVDS